MSKLQIRTRRYKTIETASAVKFPFPVHSGMRLAKLSRCAPSFGMLKPYCATSATDVEGCRPNMLLGTVAELEQLAEQVELGTIDLSCVDHAVIALTRCGQAPITDVARVILWQAFGVPVYEMFIGLDSSIIGYECELHEGWHLAPGVNFREFERELILETPGVAGLHTALTGFLTNDQCPCGRTGSRLLNMQPIERLQLQTRWAAIA